MVKVKEKGDETDSQGRFRFSSLRVRNHLVAP
jgi:hypothetical protein